MKTDYKERNVLLNVLMILMTLAMPFFVDAQNNLEIKDFNQSFTFTNTHSINLTTNTNSEPISGFTAIATFKIDENGEGTIDFKTAEFKSTLVNVDYSKIQTTNGISYWNFGCTHSEKPEKIQMTIEINPESNSVQRLIVYNEGKEKAFVFY
ncbi:hypothetical protein OAD28_01230 [Flavobacteriales bacterium]|nr:hypothetical protein [Flavobacteriales bacterium]